MTQRSNLPHAAYGGTVSAITYNPLKLPGKPEDRGVFTIKAGQVLRIGMVLGAIRTGPDTGKLIRCMKTAADGSQVPFAIMAEDLDTSPGDLAFSVLTGGTYSEMALDLDGSGWTVDELRMPLRERGVYLDAARYSYI